MEVCVTNSLEWRKEKFSVTCLDIRMNRLATSPSLSIVYLTAVCTTNIFHLSDNDSPLIAGREGPFLPYDQ